MAKVKKPKAEGKESIRGFFWSCGTMGGLEASADLALAKATTWAAVDRYRRRAWAR